MPAKTPAQRRLFGAALAAKRGAEPISQKVADIATGTSEKELSKMASKPKKQSEGAISQLFLVKNPESGCSMDGMVNTLDPLVGLSGMELVPDQVHGVYHDQETATHIAEMLCKECMQRETMLEEKKEKTTDKIKKMIDKLEKQRRDHVNMVKEDPKNASKHKHHVAQLATKIDDLMTKLEAIEKSKKQQKED